MIGYHDASSALTLLIILTGASFLNLSTPSPINTLRLTDSLHKVSSSGLAVLGGRERRAEENGSMQKGEERVEDDDEKEDELFKDVDPKTLAAVLLEALNKPQMERRRKEDEGEETEEEREEIKEENKKEEEARAMDEVNRDRERDGREELELVIAAQGRKEQEREEEEERRKAQEEEEKLTEKVTSHTTSQAVPVKTEQQSTTSDEGGEEIIGEGQDTAFQQRLASLTESHPQGEQNTDEEEEQLNPEELKNLETMMKEFPSLNTASERGRDSQQYQRESRGYSTYNDIIPINKGHDLAMSKKKLKWQEETQKAMNFPTFQVGNFMNEFEDNNFSNAGSSVPQPLPPPENDMMEDDEPEEAEDEEVLSPEEEEARAKAEQEEVRRQAAEAQRAKMEEEKLADIASDMLLQYMVKQNNGNRKDRDQNRKYSSSLSNAAEDKRSDEEQEVIEDDDIDPQTIDKLIEISSKLHLPADDVVEIISDVEKKKKKDVPPEMASPRQRPLMPLSSSPSSTNGISASRIPINRNTLLLSKQAPAGVNPLKVWFQEKPPTKSSPGNQDLWIKPAKPMSGDQDRWPKLQKPASTNQDLWLKPQKSFWNNYPPYSSYPSYYQKNPYRGYYPIYFPPLKPKLRYYVPKPALTLNSFQGNSANYDYYSAPKRRFRNWVQPRLRKPPANLQQNSYYTNYVVPSYTRTIQPLPIPKPRSPSRMAVIPHHQKQFYYSPAAPVVTRDEDYYSTQIGNQANRSNDDNLEKYIQQILMNKPRMFE